MSQQTLSVIGIVIIAVAIIIYFFNKKLSEIMEKNKPDSSLMEWLKTMQSTVENTQKTVNEAIGTGNKNITDTLMKHTTMLNQRLDKAAEVIGNLQKEAGKFSEVSNSMKSLQDFLQSPKLRGNIGEFVLNDLLSQSFPKGQFFLQYSFHHGEKADAVLKTDAGLLCIDSKFPMENFQKMVKGESEALRVSAQKEFVRDVKKHIDDIAKKYILPEEGTMDFALMYIPSEPVYYEIVNTMDLTEHARQKRVYPVSPTTMYAHLQIILRSLEGKEFEKKSKEVLANLRAIQQESGKFGDMLSVLNRHITNAYNVMSNTMSGFTQLSSKIQRIQSPTETVIEEKLIS